MFHIIFMGSTFRPLTIGELLDVLVRSREKNLEAGITGVLFYRDGNFLGCLEGEEAEVKSLFEEVRRDPLHQRVIALFSERISRREFSNWSMGFRELHHPMPGGFNTLLNKDWSEMDLRGLPMKVRAFMRIFAECSTGLFAPPPGLPGREAPPRERPAERGRAGAFSKSGLAVRI